MVAPRARVPHVDKSDIQRPRHERLEVLKGDAAAAAGPNTALLKRLPRPDNNGESSRDLRY